MKAEFKTITPDFAAHLLARNSQNRKLRKTHVDSIARDMLSGRFQTNGDAIRVSITGDLIDGQHRLSACVQSGVPFTTLLVTDLPDDVRVTIDGGLLRQYADRLSMRGVQNSNSVGAALRVIAMFAYGSTAIPKLTSQELDQILAANPSIQSSASITNHAFPGMGAKLAGAHYVLNVVHGIDVADAYLGVWKTGVQFYDGCPAHLLRERLIRIKSSTTTIRLADLMSLLAVSMNKFAAFEKTRIVKPSGDCTVPGWNTDMLFGTRPEA